MKVRKGTEDREIEGGYQQSLYVIIIIINEYD